MQDAPELEVGPQPRLVDLEPCRLDPLGVERPVPRLQRPSCPSACSAASSSAASSRALATAGPTRAPSIEATASTVPAVRSATTYDAWSANPSSAARSARRAAISVMTSRVSCSLPRRPRLTAASCRRRRSARLVSDASAGWAVGRTRVIR